MEAIKKVICTNEAAIFFRKVFCFDSRVPHPTDYNRSDIYIPALFMSLFEFKDSTKLCAIAVDENNLPDFKNGMITNIKNLIGTAAGTNFGIQVSRDHDNDQLFVISTDDPAVAEYLY